jgi:hypothetical protein
MQQSSLLSKYHDVPVCIKRKLEHHHDVPVAMLNKRKRLSIYYAEGEVHERFLDDVDREKRLEEVIGSAAVRAFLDNKVTYLGEGGYNFVERIQGTDLIVRKGIKPLSGKDLSDARMEMRLATVMGRAKIGPEILWFEEVPEHYNKAWMVSVQTLYN